MITGFNHNIQHKGQLYHVQTEDSGVKHAQITTHLYIGGNVIASAKSGYQELIGQDDITNTVRSMMQEQHKQVLRNLVHGEYDNVETGNVHHLDGPAPINTDPAGPKETLVPSRPPAPLTDVADPGKIIFGADLISERSLDEVILDYLAEDLN